MTSSMRRFCYHVYNCRSVVLHCHRVVGAHIQGDVSSFNTQFIHERDDSKNYKKNWLRLTRVTEL